MDNETFTRRTHRMWVSWVRTRAAARPFWPACCRAATRVSTAAVTTACDASNRSLKATNSSTCCSQMQLLCKICML